MGELIELLNGLLQLFLPKPMLLSIKHQVFLGVSLQSQEITAHISNIGRASPKYISRFTLKLETQKVQTSRQRQQMCCIVIHKMSSGGYQDHNKLQQFQHTPRYFNILQLCPMSWFFLSKASCFFFLRLIKR